MLEVAVIGAGASGLVASRHLIGQGLRPCIFDAAKTLGGAWSSSSSENNNADVNADKDRSSTTSTLSSQAGGGSSSSSSNNNNRGSSSNNRKMWNGLHTNLSKHTCRFSDWPWPSSDLISPTPTFPSSIQMNQYLESYASEYVNDPTLFQFQCQVTNIAATASSSSSTTTTSSSDSSSESSYRVEWVDLTSQTKHSKEFDGVVVATGYFSKPYIPDGITLTTTKDYYDYDYNLDDDNIFIHSADYFSPDDFSDESVAVIGNSFSALEIAVDVSTTAKHVVNIVPSIPWVLPRYVIPPPPPSESNDDGTTETTASSSRVPIPIDLALYQRKTKGPNLKEKTKWTTKDYIQRHQYLEQMVGTVQSSTPLGLPRDYTKPPIVAISDYYLDLVKAGRIDVCHGRFTSMMTQGSSSNDDEDHKASFKLCIQKDDNNQKEEHHIDGITKIICCTGYEGPNLESFLDEESILNKLEYDSNDKFAPLLLCWDTFHPTLPKFAFCGMTKGIYMGVMELQAKLAAQYIVQDDDNNKNKQDNDDLYQEALEISKQIRTIPSSERLQFPHPDYIGFMDTLSKTALNADYPSDDNVGIGEIVCPGYYTTNQQLCDDTKDEINNEINGKINRLPGVVVSSMITGGPWKFQRQIRHLHNNKSETVSGTIQYSRRPENLDAILYREDGLYEYVPGKVMEVFREYEYTVVRPPNGDEILEIYFIEGGERAHLFLSLKFTDIDDDGYCIATSDHLCIKDLYKGTFKVKLDGMAATEIIISYRVKGPAKDYESTTTLTPA